jgi:hypothetical protein
MQENLELGNTQEKHNGNKKERYKTSLFNLLPQPLNYHQLSNQ